MDTPAGDTAQDSITSPDLSQSFEPGDLRVLTFDEMSVFLREAAGRWVDLRVEPAVGARGQPLPVVRLIGELTFAEERQGDGACLALAVDSCLLLQERPGVAGVAPAVWVVERAEFVRAHRYEAPRDELIVYLVGDFVVRLLLGEQLRPSRSASWATRRARQAS